MTKDNIIKLAREAGFIFGDPFGIEEIERFVNLVAAHKAEVALAEAYRCGYEAGVVAEREAIALLATKTVWAGQEFAAAIRARKTT